MGRSPCNCNHWSLPFTITCKILTFNDRIIEVNMLNYKTFDIEIYLARHHLVKHPMVYVSKTLLFAG